MLENTSVMAKKTRVKITCKPNSPVILVIIFLSLCICVVQNLVDSDSLKNLFSAPGMQGSPVAFNFKNPLDYLRIFVHILGCSGFQTLAINILFLLILGPSIEDRFGSPFIAIMILICSIVTSVVNVCFFSTVTQGLGSIVWALFLLTAFPAENRKVLPFAALMAVIILIAKDVSSIFVFKNYSVIPQFIGGVSGSLISFAASAPKRASRSKKAVAP